MTRYLAITIFALLFITLNTFGQVSEETEVQPGELSLRIKNINFVKNNEYFNPISASRFILISSIPWFIDKSAWIEGYTILGYFIQPELVYSPSGKVTLRGGIHLLKYSGTEMFSQVRPVFSTSLNLSEKTSLTIGTLSGSDKHRLFDPHFDRERLYNAYAEDGLQLTSGNDHLFNDTWLSWENFIFKTDSTREVFTFGESFRYISSPVADFLRFEVPVQVQFKHFGGQISNYPEHVETYFNLATGLRISFDLVQKRYGVAGIEYLQFINNVFPERPSSVILHGYASWFRFHYTYKALYIGATYWKAHNFYAPNGNAIYASVIDIHSNYVVPERRIITNFVYLTLLPESYLELFLGLETFYDVCQKRLNYATTLHLNFDKLVKLATIKH
ncbi:MAG: hypothetical protein NTV31_11895 [Bacteroidia bacterium]|nr:hypothetical protein [Bacteroidia bacterium]